MTAKTSRALLPPSHCTRDFFPKGSTDLQELDYTPDCHMLLGRAQLESLSSPLNMFLKVFSKYVPLIFFISMAL